MVPARDPAVQAQEAAILFVVVLGAAPSIANGLINGVDNIPPILLRAGAVLGARRLVAVPPRRRCPAALPSFVGGLKQGWAFAWRSLMAGELLVIIAHSRRSASCWTPIDSSPTPRDSSR